MNSSRWPFYTLIAVLFSVGLAQTLYRHVVYQVPVFGSDTATTWDVEARIQILAEGEPTAVRLARPTNQAQYTRFAESTASAGFGLAYLDEDRLEWTKRETHGDQLLFYRVSLLQDPMAEASAIPAPPIKALVWEEPYRVAAEQLIESVSAQSAGPASFARQLFIRLFNGDQNIGLLQRAEPNTAKLAVRLLNQAGIAAAQVHAVKLEDGRRRQAPVPLVSVWLDDNIQTIFDPNTGKAGVPKNHILWTQDGGPLLEVVGGYHSHVSFSIIKQQQSIAGMVQAKTIGSPEWVDFSIHTLPLEEQALFKTILLIPVGAFVVCLLRIFVGLRTSGTFMPVLIALAFIQTSLTTGLVGFILIVLAGLVLRGYLSQLNLLLVARISAVIITVIAIIAGISVVSYHFGFNQGLKITFFPMIILAWTIERMSILWEEDGPHEVLVQGGGSLFTALITYLVMTNDLVRHLTFNFIGIQFILLAAILAIGNYTGYRLFELFRFNTMTDDAR